MDQDSNDITSNGLNNTLTRDGQGVPTANLPMAGFRHTGVQSAQGRTDYAAAGQVQDALLNWAIAGGTADAITATYTPAIIALVDGQLCSARASAANATATPTFSPNGLTARTITKIGGSPLVPGDIPGNLAEFFLRFNLANTVWELLNPAIPSLFSTGDVKFTLKNIPDPGWIMANDGTIGNVGSGSTFASVAALALYTLIWTNVSNTWAAIQDSTGAGTTRGVSAASDFAALKRLPLTKMLGRALAIAGTGSGLTARALGQSLGEEAHLLTIAEMPSHDHGYSDPGHPHTINQQAGAFNLQSGASSDFIRSGGTQSTNTATTGITFNAQGGGGAHNVMQPTSFFNLMIKL